MTLIKKIWDKWLKIAHVIGNFQGQVILTIFYFLLLWPIGFFLALFIDPINLKIKKNSKTNFENFAYKKENIQEAKHPY